jgi:soluble lytic murein transglycosylase
MLATGSGLADRVDRQREQFLAAEAALRSGDRPEFRRIRQTLSDYPLSGYLDYRDLQGRLGSAPAREVDAFLRRYAEQPIATRLRSSWLRTLGKRKDWDNYLAFYVPQSSISLQCYHIRARLQNGEREPALQDALALWLVGHSQPDTCDPAFDQLYATGMIDSALIWERIRLAFSEQKSSLAGYLAKRLSAADRTWVQRWEQAHRQPTAAINQPWAAHDTPLVRDILVHAVQRLARHKPDQAWKHWQTLSATHAFSDAQQGEVLARIALNGAVNGEPGAADWLARVPPTATDAGIRQWRVRVALLAGGAPGRWRPAAPPETRLPSMRN